MAAWSREQFAWRPYDPVLTPVVNRSEPTERRCQLAALVARITVILAVWIKIVTRQRTEARA